MSFEMMIQKIIEKKPALRKKYTQHDPYIEVSNLISAARIYKGFSQEELAKLVGAKQSSIARLESGRFLPNVTSLDKIAKALGSYLIIRFGFMEEIPAPTYILNIVVATHGTGRSSVVSNPITASDNASTLLPISLSNHN